MELKDKKIILGITGSIAAYKSAVLVRQLIKAGAEVQVLMTDSATKFIAPLTLSTLSKRPVFTSVTGESGWNNHVELGLWADALVIAPLTATTMGKMSNAICDNMIVATYLSARCPSFIAPAMDLDMWKHPATLRNLDVLQQDGCQLIDVGVGELASGLHGAGRMAEPEDIVAQVAAHLRQRTTLSGKRYLVTAGPTYEAIDPVRYLGNPSSGKMGVAIAECLAQNGASVELVLGPSALKPNHPHLQVHRVRSAAEMYAACAALHPDMDGVVFAAAVADYRPKTIADKKLKKGSGDFHLELERTTDIAATLGANKRSNQLHVGFALETNNEQANAERKLSKKNFDLIVLNSLADSGAGFQGDTNKVTLFFKNGNQLHLPLRSKKRVAEYIVEVMIDVQESATSLSIQEL